MLARNAVTMLPHKPDKGLKAGSAMAAAEPSAITDISDDDKKLIADVMNFSLKPIKPLTAKNGQQQTVIAEVSVTTQLNNDIIKALGDMKNNKLIDRGSVASLTIKTIKEKPRNALLSTYHKLVKKYGRGLGTEVYNAIRNVVKTFQENHESIEEVS